MVHCLCFNKSVRHDKSKLKLNVDARFPSDMKRTLIAICFLLLLNETNSIISWRRRRLRVRGTPICVPVNCQVGTWTSWSSCSHQCGTSGTQERTRQQVLAASCGGTCPYHLHQTRACNRDCRNGGIPHSSGCSCRAGYGGTCCNQVHGGWSSWNGWTSCSQSCGSGSQERSRTCTSPRPLHGGRSCAGAARQTQKCNKQACPVHGGWSSWSGWTSCSQSCGSGSQERFRACTSPPPRYGGRSCAGAARQTQKCNKQACPVDGRWSGWNVWSSCSKPCDVGTQERSRSCTNPRPRNGGKSRPGAANEQRVCNTHSCPVDGGWSSWSMANACSVSCGKGVEILSRSCTNPVPKHGGKSCSGNAQKQQACTRKPCPIDGGWSNWSTWTPCSHTCGTGFQERSRSCTQPAPKHGGKACHGDPRESRECNVNSCPVDGRWSVWGSWFPCGKTCGGGVRERTRSCTNPPPFHGGKTCGSDYHESKECAVNKCPVHGGWSKWSNWTECSVTCGAGVMSRERHCDNPAPAYGGNPFEGRHRDRKSCVTGEVCIAGKGCYDNYPSVLLGSYTDEIDWFARFASQMETIIKKCAELAVKKRYRYFAVEGYGNCYGAQNSPSGGGPKATRCNFGVGLNNHYYVYEVSL